MPFKSKKQQGFAYAHPEKFGGKKKLKEWSDSTNFAKIPEKVHGGNTVLSAKHPKALALTEAPPSNLATKAEFVRRSRKIGGMKI